ncbi:MULTISPECIES: AraC family transcriptional regulator [unclassified Pseudomonas]|uniref:AraC family transcriptional regulator n=1 Tax=unclassified Pseudomonas TaxID=196821 RepID=UPI0006D3CE45|nr:MULTISPECIES: AraC family transcriptional regulator [unclassified Pseudomonas]
MREIYSVFNSNGAYETGAHEHDEFMLMVPEHGLLRFKDEQTGRTTSVVDRQFVLVPPQWSHSSSSLTASQGHVAFYVDPDYMNFALRDLSGDANRLLRLPTLGIWHASAPLHHLLLTKKAFSQPDPYIDRRRQITQTDHLLLLECLAISLSQPSLQRSSTERHGAALVRDVQRYLNGNLDQPNSLDELAAAFHISRRHLTRLFAQHTGLSVLAYLQQLRLERAGNLLLHTRLSVLEIANSVGLESPSHLAHLFRRAHGCAPDEFRRQAQH